MTWLFGDDEPAGAPLRGDVERWMTGVRQGVDPVGLKEFTASLPGPRNRLHAPEAMRRAEARILTTFVQAGWRTERWPFRLTQVRGFPDYGIGWPPLVYPSLEGANLVALKSGVTAPREAVVVVAHYDTRRDSPGADDNGASVAVITELARLLRSATFHRSVLLVATDMEEIGSLGARPLVAELKRSYRLVGAINLETVGYVCAVPHSQRLLGANERPGILYRTQALQMIRREWRGDFAFVIYRGRSVKLASAFTVSLRRLVGPDRVLPFRDPGDLRILGPVLRLVARNLVRQFSRSDHVRFWERRVPAIMVTDTADFRYPHYHEPTDTADKLDYAWLADVTAGVAGTIGMVAGLVSPGDPG